jgi:hypothetical protein
VGVYHAFWDPELYAQVWRCILILKKSLRIGKLAPWLANWSEKRVD